mgnify:CR=1 FL=1
MSRRNVRAWKLALPLAALALGMTFLATSAFGASGGVVKVAVMTDCKGAFGGAYEVGAAGTNSLRFMGRLRGRALKRGKYRLVAVAVDAAGNRSKPVRRSFRIK